jgi:staphylococcal nuclease domain-containing protein 1
MLREVKSGDMVVIHRTMKDGSTQEKQLNLSNLSAPRLGNANRVEEAFSFDAREFVRSKCIGQKCEFHVDYAVKEREYGVLKMGDENINELLLAEGLVKLFEKSGKNAEDEGYQALKAIQEEAIAKHKGVHNTDPAFIKKHTRDVTYNNSMSFQPRDLLLKAEGIDAPLAAIIEYVFSPTLVSVYILKFDTVCRLQMQHLFVPKDQQQHSEKGKSMVYKLINQKNVGIKFSGNLDGSDIMIGRIHFPAGDIACEILKGGYAKVQIPKDKDGIDGDYLKKLKQNQTIA